MDCVSLVAVSHHSFNVILQHPIQTDFWLPLLKEREENVFLVAIGIAKAETDLSVLCGFPILGHQRRYMWIICMFSRVVLFWMNHYSFIGLLWHSVLFTVFHISQSVFSPKIFFIWGLFQMCISHGFQLFNAFWEVYTDARSGVLWLEKKSFLFLFVEFIAMWTCLSQ